MDGWVLMEAHRRCELARCSLYSPNNYLTGDKVLSWDVFDVGQQSSRASGERGFRCKLLGCGSTRVSAALQRCS